MAIPSAISLLSRPFYFVRHGESESNLSKTIAGSIDAALTELGHRQAQATAVLLKPVGVTAIYSSALRRARDTADHIASALALPVTVISELAERNWGALEGQPQSLRVREVAPPGAETPEQFTQRVLRGLARINTGVPLIVAHSGVHRVLCRILGVDAPEAPVANAHPVRFVPSAQPGGAWRMETL
jgi:probable phosphoglycerate mutase